MRRARYDSSRACSNPKQHSQSPPTAHWSAPPAYRPICRNMSLLIRARKGDETSCTGFSVPLAFVGKNFESVKTPAWGSFSEAVCSPSCQQQALRARRGRPRARPPRSPARAHVSGLRVAPGRSAHEITLVPRVSTPRGGPAAGLRSPDSAAASPRPARSADAGEIQTINKNALGSGSGASWPPLQR